MPMEREGAKENLRDDNDARRGSADEKGPARDEEDVHHLPHDLKDDQVEQETGVVSCETGMHDRTPSPIVWASGGGDSPRTPSSLTLSSNVDIPIERLGERDDHHHHDQGDDPLKEGGDHHDHHHQQQDTGAGDDPGQT